MTRFLFLLAVVLALCSTAGAQTTTSTSSSTSSTSTSTTSTSSSSSSTSTSSTTTTLPVGTANNGSFGTITTVTATSQVVLADGAVNLFIFLTGTLGDGVAICQQSGDRVSWTNVGSSASALGTVCNVNFPTGFYRVNVTTCSTCSLVPKWKWVALK